MNAEQYRALVKKLEAITEAPVAAFNQDAVTPVDATEPAGSVAADPAVAPETPPETPTPVPTTDSNQIPTIQAATFSQAYAQAAKQGLKKFKWCGVYAVKDKPQPPNPQPVKQDPMTFAKAYSLRNTQNQPLLRPSDVTQAGPNSTILKPGGGVDINKIMNQKAAPR